MATEEINKQVVRDYVEAFNAGDMAALRALFAEDALVYGVLGWGGMDKVIPIWQELHDCLAIHLTIEEIIGEGATVAVRYTERGTSTQPFRGNPATGQSYEVVAMEWFVLQGGKIHRRWGARDFAAQARQMGFTLT